MTTSDEVIKMVTFLRDHRFIGEECWADAGETERDHEGFECAAEVLEYMAWGDGHEDLRVGVGRPHVLPAPRPRRPLLARPGFSRPSRPIRPALDAAAA